MNIQIVTWNVAGLKARLDTLVQWINQTKADIICLQEIKMTENNFPFDLFNDLGYEAVINGQAQFNGVAILYKKNINLINIIESPLVLKANARFIEATFTINNKFLNIACLYAPNGNPKFSDKYDYKIKWMENLYEYAKKNINKSLILAGDFNVIPNEKAAKNIDLWIDDALYAKEIRTLFNKICNLGFIDTSKINNKDYEYSFWDFRQNSWQRNNGIRIDFLLASPYIIDNLVTAYNYKEVRGWEKPSDHIPMAIELNFN